MITKKVAIGAGAIALAVTASLTPLVAQAEPGSDTDSSASADSGTVGNAAGRRAATTNRGGTPRATTGTPPQSVVSGARTDAAPGANAAAPGANAAAPGAKATGQFPLFQNSLWWFGTPNPDAPTPVAFRDFEPLASLPDWSLNYYGWFRDLNFEACVLGLSNTITPSVGPYGTSTSSVSTAGC
jgi:hypothetical protein